MRKETQKGRCTAAAAGTPAVPICARKGRIAQTTRAKLRNAGGAVPQSADMARLAESSRRLLARNSYAPPV